MSTRMLFNIDFSLNWPRGKIRVDENTLLSNSGSQLPFLPSDTCIFLLLLKSDFYIYTQFLYTGLTFWKNSLDPMQIYSLTLD